MANGDGSEVQLLGGARVDSAGPRGEPIEFRGEFLHAFLNTERVRSHLPVMVTSDGQRNPRGRHGVRPPDAAAAAARPDARAAARRPRQGQSSAGSAGQREHQVTAPLVFITGASSGIGQALALRFARAGWRLALVARRGAELQAWVDAQGLAPSARRSMPPTCATCDSIVAAGRACIAAQGLPDVVIANAGISVGMDTAEFDDLEVMRATFETNNIGMAATFHPFVQAMRAARQRHGWWASPAWPASAACRGTAPIAPARRPSSAYCESLRGECRAGGRARW